MTAQPTNNIYNTFVENVKNFMESLSMESVKNSVKESLNSRASMDLNDANTISVFQKNLKKSSIMFIFIFISSILIYYISTDKNALDTKIFYYLFISLIPIIFGLFIVNDVLMPSDKSSSYEPFLKGALYLFIVGAIIGVLSFLASSANTLIMMNYIVYILIFLIILTGLAIGYFIFSNYLKQQTGTMGLIVRILFYLPCLFSDFINYLRKELSITSNVVFILLILQIVFIGLYAYLPKWINKLAKMNSNILLYDPVDLNIERTIAGSKHFLVKNLEEMDESGRESIGDKINKLWYRLTNRDKLKESEIINVEPTYRDNNYSISFWAYVNPGGPSDNAYMSESNILNYANGKPRITYVSNGQYKGSKYNVYFSNVAGSLPIAIELNDGYQKWNNFVITYHDQSADIFINGKLVRTEVFDKNNIPLAGDESDTITVGQSNGLKGAICNVRYYHYALSPREISTSFNILRFKNPPILV
jgi:hypothetical protein